MSKKSIKKNYIYNLSYQLLLVVAPLITTPYLSRVLGADGIGTISFADSVVSYFVLFATMGVATYGQREISYVQDSIENRSLVFWNTKILNIIIAIMVLIIYVMFVFFNHFSILYILMTINIVSVMADVTWFFQGMEEFGKIVLRNTIVRIVNIIFIFVTIRSKNDVALYIGGMALFNLLSNISMWFYLPKYIQFVKIKQLKPFKDFKIIISLFIPTIAIQIYTVLDKTMIGIITDNSFENGYYDQALKMSKIVLAVVTALGTVMIPRIGYCYEKKQFDEIRRLMYRGYRFVWFVGIPLCCGLIMISSNFVPWFFGPGYNKVVDLLQILSFLILAIGINNVTGMQYLIPTKRQNIFTLTVIIGAITNFLMNIVLIRILQSNGAAIASVMAETTIAIVQLIIVRKELSLLRVIKEGKNYYIAGGIMTIVLFLIRKQFCASIFNTIILTGIGGIIYFVCLWVMGDEFFISNIKMILTKMRKA